MSSYISSFKWLLVALALVLGAEAVYYSYEKPSFADRTNFVPMNAQSYFNVTADRYIIWDKLKTDYGITPEYVQVGDSSGFYGIVPEVVERHLGGDEYLNLSCCGNQGWHGYLGILEFALRKYDSVHTVVVHAGLLNVPPDERRWRRGARSVTVGNQAPRFMLGEAMERDLASVWRWGAVPTAELRFPLRRYVFLGRWPREGAFYTNLPFTKLLRNQRERQGYAVENDHQKVNLNTYGGACDFKIASFWNWGQLARETYYRVALRELSNLAEDYGVRAVLAPQITPCQGGEKGEKLRAHLTEIASDYAHLDLLFTPNRFRGPRVFSTGVHAQRGFAVDISHELGRGLRQLREADRPVEDGGPYPVVEKTAESALTSPALSILEAERLSVRSNYWQQCSEPVDRTAATREACDGAQTCRVPLMDGDRDQRPQGACRPVYRTTFSCGDGPARTARVELNGNANLRGEAFELSCAQPAEFWTTREDAQGLYVVDATYGAQCGGDRFNAFFPVKGRCDGLETCDFDIPMSEINRKGIRSDCTPELEVEYYCGRQRQTADISVPSGARRIPGGLACDTR